MDQPSAARFGLIGCGAIGSALDETAAGDVALTHAAAIVRSPQARLVAVCDSNAARAVECAGRRGAAHMFTDYRAMLKVVPLDAVSIATPPVERLAMIEAAVEAGIRLIWCEKPLAQDAAEAAAIVHLVADRGVILAVNYLRRWTATARRMIDLARSGSLGPFQGGVAYYGKGLANNGSHLIDLLNGVLGAPDAVKGSGCVADDRVGGDETVHAELRYGAGTLHVIGTDHRRFSMFELDLLFAGGRLRLTEKGNRLDVELAGPDPVFPGYTALRHVETLDGGLRTAFDRILAQLLAVRAGAEFAPLCTAADGAAALGVVEAIRR